MLSSAATGQDSGDGTSGSTGAPWIDTWDRAAVVAAYRAEFERTAPDAGFTGDVEACVAGTTSQAFRDSELQRVNWYRRMGGVELVTEDASYTADAQHTALMMAAKGDLSHDPDPAWPCYSAQGASGAGNSNLALGSTGADSINQYMRDEGNDNTPVGHRRWILSPYVEAIGMGDAIRADASDDNAGWRRYANALYIIGELDGDADRLRESRGFVAWPPPGYVPATAVWRRWSFGRFDSVDFAAASVTVTNDSGAVPLEIVNRNEGTGYGGAGSRALVWQLTDLDGWETMPEPTGGDECYTVTISGVRVGGLVQEAYVYQTCLLDLSAEPPAPIVPSAPQSFDATDVGHDAVTLSWTLDSQPEGVTVNSYVVERLDGAGWIELHSSPTPLTNYTARGLTPSTEYRFRVRLDTTSGDASAAVTVTTGAAPIVPPGRTDVTATGGVNEFSASWRADDDGGSPITHWVVSTSGFSETLGASVMSRHWTNLDAGQYTVRVRACNDAGCGPDGTASATVTDPVAGLPGRADVTATGGVNEFSASWRADDDGGSPITHWVVSTSGFSETLGASVMSRRWTNQDAGQYTVGVRACNDSGCGPDGTASATVTDPVTDPVVALPGRADVTAIGGVNEFAASWWAADDGGSPITAWQVSTGPFGARFAAATTNYRWTDQDAGRYTIRVRACNDVGCGPERAVTVVVTDPVAVVPGRAHVTASGGVNEFSVSWWADDAGSPITHWEVSAGRYGGRFGATTMSWRWTGPEAGLYTIRVRACNDAGCGTDGTATVTVTDPPATVPGLARVFATGGVNEFSASWRADDGGSPVTAWQVSTGSFGARFGAWVTNYRWADQEAGRYTIRVRACNAVGCGPERAVTVVVTDPVAVVPGRAHVTATGGVNEFSASWWADDAGSPITHWEVSAGRHGGTFATPTMSRRWTGAEAGRHTIRVQACNAVGCGPEGSATVTVTDPRPAKRVILSVGEYAGAGSPRQLAGCSSRHCYFMKVDLEGFDRSGTYDVQCHHRGIPGSSAGTWSGTLRISTWPMRYNCSFGYPGYTVFVRVRDTATGGFIDSNDIVWPSNGGRS